MVVANSGKTGSAPGKVIDRQRGGGGGGCTHFMHGRSIKAIAVRPSHTYKARTEHVGLSPTRQTSRAPSAKRRDVFGESYEA